MTNDNPMLAKETAVDETKGEEKKRSTVCVTSALDRPIQLHAHQVVPDDGGGRSFQGRVLGSGVILQSGTNPGVDKEFFDRWCEQNKGSDLLPLLKVEDETEEKPAD